MFFSRILFLFCGRLVEKFPLISVVVLVEWTTNRRRWKHSLWSANSCRCCSCLDEQSGNTKFDLRYIFKYETKKNRTKQGHRANILDATIGLNEMGVGYVNGNKKYWVQNFGKPFTLCGNGFRDGSETCDDDNPLSRDGCSSLCTVESGWSCTLRGIYDDSDVCNFHISIYIDWRCYWKNTKYESI